MAKGAKTIQGPPLSENGHVPSTKVRRARNTGRTFSSSKPLPAWLPTELPSDHAAVWPIIEQINSATELPKGAIQFSKAFKRMTDHEQLATEARKAMLQSWEYLHGSRSQRQQPSTPADRARAFYSDMRTTMLLRFCPAYSIDANGMSREQVIDALVQETVNAGVNEEVGEAVTA